MVAKVLHHHVVKMSVADTMFHKVGTIFPDAKCIYHSQSYITHGLFGS